MRRPFFALALAACVMVLVVGCILRSGPAGRPPSSPPARATAQPPVRAPSASDEGGRPGARMDWWRAARFGMFVHWGRASDLHQMAENLLHLARA